MALEDPAERRFRLIAHCLGDAAGGLASRAEPPRRLRHADLQQHLGRRRARGLLEQARERGARHVASLGHLFQRPRQFGRFQHAVQRRLQSALRQHGEQAGDRRGLLQPRADQQREQRRRQLRHDGAGAGTRRLAAIRLQLQHRQQVVQAGRLRPVRRVHDDHGGQRGQQAGDGVGLEAELAAQHVGGGAGAVVAHLRHHVLARHRQQRQRLRAGAVGAVVVDVQPVRRPVREDDDVADRQRQAALGARVDAGAAAHHHVIGRDAVVAAFVAEQPGRAELAAHIERRAQGIQGQKAAEGIHGFSCLRRMSKL